jgi:hypothetical protein
MSVSSLAVIRMNRPARMRLIRAGRSELRSANCSFDIPLEPSNALIRPTMRDRNSTLFATPTPSAPPWVS